MPIQAQSADGLMHEFPDGTDRAVIDRTMKAYAAKSGKVPSKEYAGVPERMLAGAGNPVVGAARLGAHLGEAAGLPIDAAAVDKFASERERKKNERTDPNSRVLGIDPAELAGEMLNPINAIPAARGAQAIGAAAKIARGAAGGALAGAMDPKDAGTGNYWTDLAAKSGGGAVLGGGLGTMGAVGSRAVAKAGVSVEDIERDAGRLYRQLENSNTRLDGGQVLNVIDIIEGQLRQRSFRPFNADGTWAAMQDLQRELAVPGGGFRPADMADLKGFQELLKNVRGSDVDQAAASYARDLFDRYLTQVPVNHVISGNPQRDALILREAQADWRGAKRSDAVDMSIERAGRQANRSGSGANQENAVRQRIDAILNSKTESKNFSDDELATMREIVNGTKPINALRWLGKFAPTGLISSWPTVAAGSAGAAHDPVTGAAVAAGVAAPTLAAKWGAEYLTKNKARDLAAGIRAKTPYAQNTPPPAPSPLAVPMQALPALAPGAGAALSQEMGP